MLKFNTEIDASSFMGAKTSNSARNPIFEGVVSAVVELNIARKNSTAYPSVGSEHGTGVPQGAPSIAAAARVDPAGQKRPHALAR